MACTGIIHDIKSASLSQTRNKATYRLEKAIAQAKHDAIDVALTLRIQAKRVNANNGKINVLSVSLDCNDRLRIAGDERANALAKIPIPSFASLLIKNTEIERASAERGGSKKREIMLPKCVSTSFVTRTGCFTKQQNPKIERNRKTTTLAID